MTENRPQATGRKLRDTPTRQGQALWGWGVWEVTGTSGAKARLRAWDTVPSSSLPREGPCGGGRQLGDPGPVAALVTYFSVLACRVGILRLLAPGHVW